MIGNILGGAMGKLVVAGDFDSIATTTVGAGGTGTVTFSGISSVYQHLQLRIMAKTNRTAGSQGDVINMTFNSDTASNYSYHQLQGDGAGTGASGSATQTKIQLERTGDATADRFGVIIVDILDYKDTNKAKTTRQLGGFDNNGGGQIALMSGRWGKTPLEAISSITLTPVVGTLFTVNSHFALYGIKG